MKQDRSLSIAGNSHRWEHMVITACILVLAALGGNMFWSWVSSDTPETLVGSVPVGRVLSNHTKEFEHPQIVKVTDGIHMAIGYALANSILLEAPEGAIIVDTTENEDAARDIYNAFRNITKAPIKAIIYTHNHGDHISGVRAFIEDPENPPEIWGYHTLVKQVEIVATVDQSHFTRSMRQFGSLLPEGAHINSGIGRHLMAHPEKVKMAFVPPNKLLTEDEQDVIIAGMPVRLVHIPGETSDQMGVWIPELRAFLCGDDLYRTFPNLYAVRGTPNRNVLEWVSSLDKMRALKPQFIVPSHTQPLIGEDHIYETLTQYRDAIQFVHDQTVRYMNKGLYPDDIAAKVKLPEKLASNPFLYQLYGTVGWSVKAVFCQYMGWFSGNPTELSSMTTVERAEKMVRLLGSVSSLVRAARSALDDEDFQWALELASHVFVLQPDHYHARDIRLQALKALAAQQTSPNGRNYYLTTALEDHNMVTNKLTDHVKQNNIPDRTAQLLWVAIKGRMMPETCGTVEKTTVFNFTDTEEVFSLHMRHGILEVVEGDSEKYDIRVSVSLAVWKELLVQTRSPLTAYVGGHLVVEGGITGFGDFMKCFDTSF